MKSKDSLYFHTSSSPVEANNSKSANPDSTVKSKDSRIGKDKMQTADRVQNAD